jgi:hypothetical protein
MGCIDKYNKANQREWDAGAQTFNRKGIHHFYFRYFPKEIISTAVSQKNIK